MMLRMILFVFILIVSPSFCVCFELLSTTITALGAGALGASYASFKYLKCRSSECCDNSWIHFNVSKLDEKFQNLFGQHLAESVIRKSLQGYFKNPNRKKPLVMAFHGFTGSGKNYAANLIADSIYINGMASKFVHLYIGTRDFPHKREVSRYQDQLRKEIPQYTKECGNSLFIFDEIDKMPPGTLDALKPFIDYYGNIDDIDYRNNIFIFLSNSGSNGIMEVSLKFWADGLDREDITMKDIEPLINIGAFNENGGFHFSELLRSELIDVFVPFLPLEKSHVKKCIEVEMKKRHRYAEKSVVNEIADQLVYFPTGIDIYSKSGCKRIDQKIDLFMDF